VTRVSLDVIEGPAAGYSLEVPPEGLLIGRSGTLAGDDTVSHQHADVTWTSDGSLAVRDLGSTNGTYVNGTRITGRTILRPGDELALGDTVLTVVSRGAAPGHGGGDVFLEGGRRAGSIAAAGRDTDVKAGLPERRRRRRIGVLWQRLAGEKEIADAENEN
jgi:pSer/pThr/pTyr-binding forkhead associated (FHA) protein